MFRDDLIFLIYLYQRWIYRVDRKRANEFGWAAAPACTGSGLRPRRRRGEQRRASGGVQRARLQLAATGAHQSPDRLACWFTACRYAEEQPDGNDDDDEEEEGEDKAKAQAVAAAAANGAGTSGAAATGVPQPIQEEEEEEEEEEQEEAGEEKKEK